MFGWCRLATASASRWNRARSCGSCVRPGMQHLESDEAVQAQVPRLVDDRPSRRARASPGRRSQESRGTFRPAARQAPAADPDVGNNESTWASSSRRRLKRSTDLGQQLRAGLTHVLRRAIAFRGSPRPELALVDRPTSRDSPSTVPYLPRLRNVELSRGRSLWFTRSIVVGPEVVQSLR